MAFILPDLKRWFRKKDRSLPDDLFDLVEEDNIIPHKTIAADSPAAQNKEGNKRLFDLFEEEKLIPRETIAADFPAVQENEQNNTLFEEVSPDEKINTALSEEESVSSFWREQLSSEPVSAFDRQSFPQDETFSPETSFSDDLDGNAVFSAARVFPAAQEKGLPLRAGRRSLPVSIPAVSSWPHMSGFPGEDLPRPERKGASSQETASVSANNENLSLIAQCSRKMLKFLKKNNDLLKQNGQNQFYQ